MFLKPAFHFLFHPHAGTIDPISVRGVTISVHRSIGADVVPLVVPLDPFVRRHSNVRLHEVPFVAGFQPNFYDGCSVVDEVVPVAIGVVPTLGHFVVRVKVVGFAVLEGF